MGMVPPSPIPPGKTLWLESDQRSKVDFEYAHLGAKYSLGDGSGLILRNLDITGCEQFCLATEVEGAVGYKTIFSSEAFWWQGGAEAALTNSVGIKKIVLQGNRFGSTPLMIATGGGWWDGAFSPDHANPGIENALIEDNEILGHGGFDLRAVRFGDITLRRNRFQNNLTVEELARFESLFPAQRWHWGIGLGQTGSPIQDGLRVCMRVGRTNYPYQGNDLYYFDQNGTVTLEDNHVEWAITDVKPGKTGKHEMHGIDVRGGKVIDRNNKVHNCMDLGTKAVNDGGAVYYKAQVAGGGSEYINFTGEGPIVGKPFKPGTNINELTVKRDISIVPNFALPLLDALPIRDDGQGRRITEPGMVPMISRAIHGPTEGTTVSGYRCHNFRVPPSGAEDLIVRYGTHVNPTNTKIWDENGVLVVDIP